MIESIFFNPWVWIIPIIIAIGLLVVIASIVFTIRDDTSYGSMWPIGTIIGSIVTVPLAGFYFGAVLPPYDASFYQTYRITGQVEQIESAFSGEEGTMSQVFIAKVDGVDAFIRSDDQRFRTLEVGDDLNLVCSKEFRYFQEAWFECSFGGPAT